MKVLSKNFLYIKSYLNYSKVYYKIGDKMHMKRYLIVKNNLKIWCYTYLKLIATFSFIFQEFH